MGSKTRSNWAMNFCMKSDCRFRDYGIAIPGVGTTGKNVCEECVRFDKYCPEGSKDDENKKDAS